MVLSKNSKVRSTVRKSQKQDFGQDPTFRRKSATKNIKNVKKKMYIDAEFCVDSESDVKNSVTRRNRELFLKMCF